MPPDTKINLNNYKWVMNSYDSLLRYTDDDNKNSESGINNGDVYKLLPTELYKHCNKNYIDTLKENKYSPVCPIDIVSNYNWTTSPDTARLSAPRIILTEKYIYKNNSFGKLFYTLNATLDSANDILSGFEKKTNKVVMPSSILSPIDSLQDAIPSSITNNISTSTIQTLGSSIKNAKDKIDEWVENAKSYINEYQQDDSLLAASTFNRSAKHYDKLYWCYFTGFRYELPYFDNKYRNLNNMFSDNAAGTTNKFYDLIDGVVQIGTSALATAQLMLNSEYKGFYIEQPKPYNYPSTGEQIQIQFPLINTGTWSDVCKNWQFLYLLMFQNQPSRLSKTIVDSPVIYTAEIPGTRFIPYSYIRNMNVEYKGVRRMMNMNYLKTTTENNDVRVSIEQMPVVIPEAWNITITLEGLTSEPSNFSVDHKLITYSKSSDLFSFENVGIQNDTTSGTFNNLNNIA